MLGCLVTPPHGFEGLITVEVDAKTDRVAGDHVPDVELPLIDMRSACSAATRTTDFDQHPPPASVTISGV